MPGAGHLGFEKGHQFSRTEMKGPADFTESIILTGSYIDCVCFISAVLAELEHLP